MPAIPSPRQILGGYGLAALVLTVGMAAGLRVGGDAGTLLLRVGYALAVVLVVRFTFAWGRRRGFPLRLENGRFSGSHLVRNLVMAVIVWGVLLLLTAPVLYWIVQATAPGAEK